jgi:hypothetical protein
MVDPFDPDLWFARHLAALEASYTVKHHKKAHEHARAFYSGFLLCENVPGTDMQATIWVTAGHCMQEVEEVVLGQPESYSDVRFRFIDTLHLNAVSNLPMPFDYRAGHPKSWVSEKVSGQRKGVRNLFNCKCRGDDVEEVPDTFYSTPFIRPALEIDLLNEPGCFVKGRTRGEHHRHVACGNLILEEVAASTGLLGCCGRSGHGNVGSNPKCG